MKTSLKKMTPLKALCLAAVLGVVASNAFADPTVTLDLGAYGDLGGYGGGEFTAIGSGLSTAGYASTTSSGGSFETFCMAFNEEFVPGNWGGPAYDYYLSNNTFSNPSNAVSGTLTEGTAWLYSQYASGVLQGFDYSTGPSSNQATTAMELQEAIWFLQQSPGAPAPGAGNPFVSLVETTLGSSATTNATPGFDGVQIMVLTNNNSNFGSTPNAQPQLYYSVPDNGTTVLLLGIAIVGLVGFKRFLPKRA
jgi:hypothetical protein